MLATVHPVNGVPPDPHASVFISIFSLPVAARVPAGTLREATCVALVLPVLTTGAARKTTVFGKVGTPHPVPSALAYRPAQELVAPPIVTGFVVPAVAVPANDALGADTFTGIAAFVTCVRPITVGLG